MLYCHTYSGRCGEMVVNLTTIFPGREESNPCRTAPQGRYHLRVTPHLGGFALMLESRVPKELPRLLTALATEQDAERLARDLLQNGDLMESCKPYLKRN